MEEAARIVELYTPKAYSIAYRLTGDRQQAWDLVQGAMLKVLRSYGTYDPTYAVEQWLYRIVRNLFVDRLRAEARRREQSLDYAPEEGRALAETLADPAPGPETLMARKSTKDAVQAALDSLPVEQRMAVALVDLEGYSYEEAARMLEIPASTLGVRVFRGRKSLKESLKSFMEA